MRRALPFVLLAALVLLFQGCGNPRPGGRVLVLGLDGLDPRAVDLLVSEGKLPNFAKLKREGASGALRSRQPLLSPVVWTTIATGKLPEQHGIGHFVALNPAGREIPVTRSMRRVKALWNIASEAGKTVGVVGWWATWPPEPVRGFVVSDHAAYHFLFSQGATTGGGGAATTWPPGLEKEIAPLLRRPGDLRYEEMRPFVDVSRERFDRPFDFADELSHFKWALATAISYRDIGLDLWKRRVPRLEMIYIEGTDSTAHLFGHLFRAQGLAGELAVQQRQYGRAVEEMYRFADRAVGDCLAALDPESTLVVLSDHGFDLGVLPDDPSQTRDLRRVSERYHNEQGVLYLYGREVRRGTALSGAGILDIAPTVLALLGIPPAVDMPGRVLRDALLPGAQPVRVATYEKPVGKGGAISAAAPRSSGDPAADPALLAHLRSLGYLGSPAPPADTSPGGDRVLATLDFRNGEYREAARIYQQLLVQAPQDGGLHASLGAALGALGRYDEAEAELQKAVQLAPLRPEGYHDLAVIAERRGDRGRAIELYRKALLYDPRHEPSRSALERLTGDPRPRPPASESDERAQGLAGQAALAARRGAYDEALARLHEAGRLAPRSALVWQYRANVLYLKGDRAGAIQALEKALDLETGNALFRTNLERLRSGG